MITFLSDGWLVRIQPTCSSRMAAGEAGMPVSHWV